MRQHDYLARRYLVDHEYQGGRSRATQTMLQMQELWAFTARRAAWDDMSDDFEEVVKPRLAAIGLCIQLDSNIKSYEAEIHLAQEIVRIVGEALAGQLFHYVAIDILPPGSYGAIIFVEHSQPAPRYKILGELTGIIGKVSPRLKDELKDRAIKGLVTLILGGAVILVAPQEVNEKIVCPADNSIELQRELIGARSPKEINELIEKYCRVEGGVFKRYLDAFDIK